LLLLPDEILQVYKKIYNNKKLSDTEEDLIKLFVTAVMSVIVHIANHTWNSWNLYVFVKRSPPLYSSFVMSSDKAFALFLINHYRYPPLVIEAKVKGKKALKNIK